MRIRRHVAVELALIGQTPCRAGTASGHEGHSRWNAKRERAVSIGEAEPAHRWRLDVMSSAAHESVMVLVTHYDQHVRLFCRHESSR